MPFIIDTLSSPYAPLVTILQFDPLDTSDQTRLSPLDAFSGFIDPMNVERSAITRLTIDRMPGLRDMLGVIQAQELEETIAQLYRSFTPKVAESAVLDLLESTVRELIARGTRPVYDPSLPRPLVPETAIDPITLADLPVELAPPRLTIDSIAGLRELLDMQPGGEQHIQELEQQIAHYYRRFPHAQAEAAVRDLLTTTMRNRQGDVPTVPEHRPGLLDLPIVPGQMIIPPAGNGEPIDGNGEPIVPELLPEEDEGTLLPLGIGAALFVLKLL